MGREAFLEKVWEWTDEYRERIKTQLKKWDVSVTLQEKHLQWMKI